MFNVLYLIYFVVFSVIFYNLKKYFQILKILREVRGPFPLPFLGNSHQIGSTPYEYLKSIFKYWQIYRPGPLLGSNFNRPIIFISDVEDVEVLLKSQTQLKKCFAYDLTRPFLGDGIITTSGEKWYNRRKLITQSLHLSTFIDLCDAVNKNANNCVKLLSERSKNGEIVDAQPILYNCALNVICEAAMGINFDTFTDKKAEFLKAFEISNHLLQKRLVSITLISEFLYMLTPSYWKLRKNLKIVKTFIYEVIYKRRELLKKMNEENNSSISSFPNDNEVLKKKPVFLDALLTGIINGKSLTTDEISDEVATLVTAGNDSSSCAMLFTIYCLSKHPTVQEKVFQEQKLLFGDDPGKDATYEEIAEMKYLELVIKETLRLFPSVPLIGRELTEPLELSGKIFPRGTTVVILLYTMGYNEKYFPEPNKFIPERFENNSNKSTYFPFSFGPRNCLGQRFSMLEMKCILSKIIRSFIILPPVDGLPPFRGYGEAINSINGYDARYAGIMLAHSENGLKIRLQHR